MDTKNPTYLPIILIIGYIGRLNMEIGIQNFIQALPAIISDRKDPPYSYRGWIVKGEYRMATLQRRGRSNIMLEISHDLSDASPADRSEIYRI